MPEPKWTLGPWQVYEPPDKGAFLILDAHNRNVAGTNATESRTIERANAHLIAAAPDLYAALADLVSEIETDGGLDTSEWLRLDIAIRLDIAKAALAKARGD